MSPKVSVIVPVHNPGICLKQCLDTIVNQTLKEIEIICVDDGSTDGSSFLLKQYAQKDSRIKIITQECQGAGMARNKGLEVATGDYISFLDADDFFEENMLEYLYYTAKADQSDVVICGYYTYDTNQQQDIDTHYPLLVAIEHSPLTQEQAAEYLFKITHPSCFNKLFKASFIKESGILFTQISRGEDLFFTSQILMLARKISVQGIPFLHYRKGTSFQATNPNNRPQNITPFLQMITQLYEKISASPLKEKWEKSFMRLTLESLRFELKGMIGSEKRKALKLIKKELPKDLVQKLFFNQERPAVSLVLCVYNGEKYLVECLDSLIHQSLQNIEIICVDDGSTDSSLKILNEYAQKDKRIKVLTQENKGLAISRRNAMKITTGEYVQYVDADDYLELDTCECLYLYSKIFDLDMCSFMSIEFKDETREEFEDPYNRLKWLPEHFLPVFSVKTVSKLVTNIAVSSCLTLYKNAFLKENDIQWTDKPLFFEDNPFFTEAFLRTEKFGALKDTFYHRRIHKEAITQNADKHFSDWCKIFLLVFKIVQKYGTEDILESYLENYSLKGWRIYNQFSKELKIKYKQDMMNFCKSLSQEFQWHSPEDMKLWYDDLQTITKEDYPLFEKIQDNQSLPLFYRYTNLYNDLTNNNLYLKYHSNYINHLRVDLKNTLSSCSIQEIRGLLKKISQNLPVPVFKELFDSKDRPAVSLVMAVYNTEKYLPECLDSLIHQSLQNIEIICVDDGSTDNSLKILNEYAQKDKRIKVLTQENSRQSIARRNAMKIATGEYIQYVDSDDYLDLDATECLYLYSKLYDLDMCFLKAENFTHDPRIKEVNNVPVQLRWLPEKFPPVFSYRNLTNVLGLLNVAPWATFYKHDFLKEHNIQWIDEKVVYEDTPFFIESLFNAKKIGALREIFYYRRMHEQCTVAQLASNFPDYCYVVLKAMSIVKSLTDEETLRYYFLGISRNAFNVYKKYMSKENLDKYQKTLYDFFKKGEEITDLFHAKEIRQWCETYEKESNQKIQLPTSVANNT